MEFQKVENINSFNATNYLNNYGDLSNTFGNDLEAAIRHYINYGYAEGRTDSDQEIILSTDLETLSYIASNSDLIKAFGTNLEEAREHYINYGISEGRNINSFNATNYLNNYGDLSNTFGNDLEAAIRHYINYGYAEGRTDSDQEIILSTDLETLSYIASNSDLIKAFGTNLEEARNIISTMEFQKVEISIVLMLQTI